MAEGAPGEDNTSCPAHAVLEALIVAVLPGDSPATKRLRRQVLRFCADPGARALLLRGPIGAGKSTIARLIGYAKRIAPLRLEVAQRHLKDILYDGPGRIESKQMTWYREFAITGLVDDLACAQLFGIKKGAATGALGGRGVFEQAQKDESGVPWDGVGVTGGVVFLDEIADASPALQAKLLPVLSGATFYRVGGEGDKRYEQRFAGVVVTATWQPLEPPQVRQDLLSRISAHVIDVPGIEERREDLPAIVNAVQGLVEKDYREKIREMIDSDADVDRAYWETQAKATRTLSSEQIAALSLVDWSRHGNMRGLVAAVEKILLERQEVRTVLDDLPSIELTRSPAVSPSTDLLLRLMDEDAEGLGLSGRVMELERDARRQLKRDLLRDAALLGRLAAKLGISEQELSKQLRELDRSRITKPRNRS